MKKIVISNLKGGTGKTTTAMYLAHAYLAAGKRVIMVDADPHASLSTWARLAGMETPMLVMPHKDLHKRLAGIVDESEHDVMVIDTPPLDEHAELVISAMRIADRIVLAMAPTTMEYQRVPFVADAAARAGESAGKELDLRVLLNRTVHNASSTREIGDALRAKGYNVLRTTIPRREPLAQAFGLTITRLHGHDTVAEELA